MKKNAQRLKKKPGELFTRYSTVALADQVRHYFPPEVMEDGGYAHPMDEYRGGQREAFDTTEFLVVDCRETADYEACHIKGALFYPKTRIYHATSPFLTEMYAFKNKENRVVLLYDLEEEAVCQLANTFFEKGMDNVGILAGGLREFVQDFSECIEGESPVPIVARDTRLQRRADESIARSEARSSVAHLKPKSLSTSLAKPRGSQDHFRF
ncbi:hypothetical protein AGDE_10140 [Angomonas deanei]|nr:hypothetical protein AGDE_10140 [Angomonas deanei]|eukprot:EPY29071.1 hypothetical protein AGDE_10140 [Angomonas deanei]